MRRNERECKAMWKDWRSQAVQWLLYEGGLKVHRLTKKKLCHSNETLHALNSSFPDTNSIVSFKINPHWIGNSGLCKVVLETFRERPGKLMKGVLFHQDNATAHKSVVAMAAVHDCDFELVDHPPYPAWFGTIWPFSVPQNEKHTWLGSSNGLMMRSYLQLRTFSRIRMRASIRQESKHCINDGRSVWAAGETMLKNKPHLVKFDHCIIVSLWTFQPTLVCRPEQTRFVEIRQNKMGWDEVRQGQMREDTKWEGMRRDVQDKRKRDETRQNDMK